METSLPPGPKVGVQVKEGKIRGRDAQTRVYQLRGPQLPMIMHIVEGRSSTQQVNSVGGAESESSPPEIPESLLYSGDKL